MGDGSSAQFSPLSLEKDIYVSLKAFVLSVQLYLSQYKKGGEYGSAPKLLDWRIREQ